MHKHRVEEQEAVFLFEDEGLTREMLYPEFEAILDGFVPVPDCAGRTARAVYARINADLCLTAAVFFLLDFDARGLVDRRWNVPIQQLLASAGRGPDLGAGSIALVCFSQCPIEWQQKNLWDPWMEPGRNQFAMMRKAAKRNRLGLVFQEPVADPGSMAADQAQLQQQLHQRYSQALRDRLAQLLKEQRLRIATLSSQHRQTIDALQREHQQRLDAYQQQLALEQRQSTEREQRLAALRDTLERQTQKLDGVRDYYTHKLEALQSGESAQLKSLQEHHQLEVSARVEAALAQLQEQLDMREMELFYRHQQEANLRTEIDHLQAENQRLLASGGDQLLGRLTRAGISFVAFHPGAGHMTIALEDIGRYLDNPQAFAAERCGVKESVYSAWLGHYQVPCCQAERESGHTCGASVPRVTHPGDFHPGESDRCDRHQAETSLRAAGQG